MDRVKTFKFLFCFVGQELTRYVNEVGFELTSSVSQVLRIQT